MELADYLSDISEQAYYAGWMRGLEYELWEAVVSGPKTYGRIEITDEHIAKPKELSNNCGGWIVWDEESEETWITIEDWITHFQAWKDSNQ